MPNSVNPLEKSKNIYLVGIKGVGMTALAQILQSQGKKISGSDTLEKFFTDQVLKKLKIPFKEGFKASNLPKAANLVIYSTAFRPKDHPELLAAQNKNIPLISYPRAVSLLFNNATGIAISGSHGKTTTSALVAESLKNLSLDPTALIGSRVINWGSNALVPRRNIARYVPTKENSFFVIEADEHQNKLRFYNPWSTILTNIDYDHPDYYKKESDYYGAFKSWMGKWAKRKSSLPKIGILNGDDPKISRLANELKLSSLKNHLIFTFGKGRENNFRILKLQNNKLTIEVNLPGAHIKNVTLDTNLIGQHNAYNLSAAYAFVSALLLMIRNISIQYDNNTFQPAKIKELLIFAAKSFQSFQGTERRMQYKGKKGKVAVYDDYAHHPEEIRATLSGIKKSFPQYRLFVVFQPHTYTRTKKFLKEFANALQVADQIVLLEIYGSARENSGEVSSENIQKLINRRNSKKCVYLPTHKDCVNFLNKYKFKKPTILVTMGAGDGWRVGEEYLRSNIKIQNDKSK